MSDPCDECLLKPCCTEVCEKKELYVTYIRDGQKYYRGRNGRLNLSAIRSSSYDNYAKKLMKEEISYEKIKKRGSGATSSSSSGNGATSSSSSTGSSSSHGASSSKKP